jgi:hypothetical protein
MTIDLEDQLIAGMRQEAAGTTLTTDILGAATRRHRRRTVLRRSAYTMGVLGVAGVTAAALTIGGTGRPGPAPGRPPVAVAEAPALQLLAAAAASENMSYRMTMTVTAGQGSVLQRYEGAFDPATSTGYVRAPQDDSVLVELLINGTRYLGGERPEGKVPADKGRGETYGRYGQYPGRHDTFSTLSSDAVLGAAAPDPAALFAALKTVRATVTENPDGTLHFEYDTRESAGSSTISGDLARDADGRIAKVVREVTWRATKNGKLQSGEVTETLEFSGYGLAVDVKRPADVVPAR